jgi:phosphoglycerate dehydrogenase-like enzyme
LKLKVLVSIQQPVQQWQIPVEGVETLRKRFPHIQFIHATSPKQRAEGLAACDAMYTWILKDDELAQASKLRWVHTSAVAVRRSACRTCLRGRRRQQHARRPGSADAEHVMAVTLALAKQIPFMIENQQRALGAGRLLGRAIAVALKGRTLGDRHRTISSEIARAQSFGMKVVRPLTPAYGTIGRQRVYGKAAR